MLGINCIWNHFITPIIATSSSLCWCFVYCWCKAQHVPGTGWFCGRRCLRFEDRFSKCKLAYCYSLLSVYAELVEISLKIIFCSIMKTSGTHTSFYIQNFLSRKLFTCLEIKKCTILPAMQSECGCNISVGFPALFVVRNLTRFSQKHSLFLESTSALCVPPSSFSYEIFQ